MCALEIREEACHIVYRDKEPIFLLRSNGEVHWHSLGKPSMADLKEMINEKIA